MATSAIYVFAKNHANPQVEYYIHYDGYPEGAAHYFINMLNAENRRGGFHAAFMRNNELCEFAPEGMSGEYRYVVDGDGLKAYGRANNVFFAGDILDFINQFAGVKMMKARGKYMIAEKACEEMNALIAHINHQNANGWTGNASSMVNDLWAVAKEYGNVFGKDDVYEVAVDFIEKMDRLHCASYGWETNEAGESAYQQWFNTFRK